MYVGMENPLAKYLKESKTSQAVFGARLPARQATVSGWCNNTTPSIADALRIERATGGVVAAVDWAEYVKHKTAHDVRAAS